MGWIFYGLNLLYPGKKGQSTPLSFLPPLFNEQEIYQTPDL